MEAESLHGTAN